MGPLTFQLVQPTARKRFNVLFLVRLYWFAANMCCIKLYLVLCLPRNVTRLASCFLINQDTNDPEEEPRVPSEGSLEAVRALPIRFLLFYFIFFSHQ